MYPVLKAGIRYSKQLSGTQCYLVLNHVIEIVMTHEQD